MEGAAERKAAAGTRTKRTTRVVLAATAIVMSESDAARMLGVSVRTLQRWRVEGGGPCFRKLGRRLVGYTIDDLSAFVNSARCASTSSPAVA